MYVHVHVLLYTLFELTNQIARLQVAKYLLINPPGSLINPPGSLTNPPGSLINPPGSLINPPGSLINPLVHLLTPWFTY